MCGIFAAINNNTVTDNLISGLSALTYRGYDSAGIAVVNNGEISRRRARGKLNRLSDLLKVSPLTGNVGIAHTRWATHGLPTETNAHPHMTSRVAVAHNGIVENYDRLRSKLESSGYIFESETDSETIAQLITYYMDRGLENEKALCKALVEIEGSFGVVVIFSGEENELYAARKGSPLVLGRSADGFYVSSDVNAFHKEVEAITYLKDNDVVRINQSSFEAFNLQGVSVKRFLKKLKHQSNTQDKQGYEHYMLKEIYEQPVVFERTWQHYFNNSTGAFQLPKIPFDPKEIERISLISCGTSYFASMVARYWLEDIAGVFTEVDIASEYRYRKIPVAYNSASVFVSQSGETADTLAALNHSKEKKQPCISLLNVLTSTMANESHAVLPTLAGPEIGVASTKAFISQLTSLLIFSLSLGQARKPNIGHEKLVNSMIKFPDQMRTFLENTDQIEEVARYLKNAEHILYLGRGISYPLAEEGALKLKEISYIHAEAYPAGELKHGPLALVDDYMPVVFIAPPGELFTKTLSNLREVTSRGGKVILISDSKGLQSAKEFITFGIEIPPTDPLLIPLMYTLPLQLLAYQVALLKGHDVDQPRNLAKSVTVE